MFAEDYKADRKKHWCEEDVSIRDQLYRWAFYGNNFDKTVSFYGNGEDVEFGNNVFNVFMNSFYDYHRYHILHNANIIISDFVKARYDFEIEPYEGSFDTIKFTRKQL
jgi:hypothetical protein